MKQDEQLLPPLSALELAALSSAALKGAQIRGYRPPMVSDEGGQTLTVNDTSGATWLVWAPSKPTTQAAFSRHVNVLHFLHEAGARGDVPFTISLPEGVTTRPGNGVVLAHPHPGGSVLQDGALSGQALLASSLARALAALHELDDRGFAAAAGTKASAEQTRAAYRSLVKAHSASIPAQLRRRWKDAIEDDALWRFEATPVHGNLSANSIYVSPEGAVLGICHFTSAAVADPAQDLAWLLYHADDAFLGLFQTAYTSHRSSTDLHILTRAQLISELATLRWFARGKAVGDRAWVEEGLEALRELDDAFGDHHLVATKPDVVDIKFTVDEEPLLRLRSPQEDLAESSEPSGPEADSISEPDPEPNHEPDPEPIPEPAAGNPPMASSGPVSVAPASFGAAPGAAPKEAQDKAFETDSGSSEVKVEEDLDEGPSDEADEDGTGITAIIDVK